MHKLWRGKEVVWTDHISIPVLSMCPAATNVSRTDSVRLPVPPRIHLGSLNRPAGRAQGPRQPTTAYCLHRESLAPSRPGDRGGRGKANCTLLQEDTEARATPPTAPHLAAQALKAAPPSEWKLGTARQRVPSRSVLQSMRRGRRCEPAPGSSSRDRAGNAAEQNLIAPLPRC